MTVNIDGVTIVDRLKSRIMAKGRELNVDPAVQNMVPYRKNKRMICFYMDNTLVDMEGIAYNAKRGPDRAANAALSRARFNHVFHLPGITEEDIVEAMTCRPL
jgi:hypothetical protein